MKPFRPNWRKATPPVRKGNRRCRRRNWRWLRQGVAKDRRISVADADIRPGRKSASRLIDGSKRHVMHDLTAPWCGRSV
jgi:hypothetical protein